MSKHVRLAIVLCLLALSMALGAMPASAAPTAWSFVDIGLHLEQGQPMLLVSGDLPETVQLPSEAELAVPAGTQLQWIGEILGGPPEQDPALKYVKTTVGDMDIYRFTLTKSRTAQIEAIASGVVGTSGLNQTTAIKWTAWQDLPSVRLSQRLPLGSQVVQPSDGASIQAGSEEYSYYSKTVTDVKAGAVLDLTFAYTLPASAPSVSAGDSTNTIAVFLIVGTLLLAGGLLFTIKRKPTAAVVETPRPAASKRASTPKASTAKATPTPVLETNDGRSSGSGRKLLMFGAFVAMLIMAFVLGGVSSGGSAKDGRISKFFGAPSACSSASFALMANQGVDLSDAGKKIVDAFSGSDGIGDVTLTIATATLDVTYCESSQSEESIRQIVQGTGLVSLAAPPVASVSTSATLDPTGTKQTATVDTATGSFNPGTVALKAGLPSEIAFGQAAGCLTEVIFTDLGITQTLGTGATTVTLPGLEPGTYAFACAMGHQTGSLLVQ